MSFVLEIAGSAPTIDERPKPQENKPKNPILPAPSSKMQTALAAAQRYAPRTGSILILGETGTGKTRMASQIHAWSGRKGPFVVFDCAAASHDLIESELFGHAKGAFTGADRARKGAFERANSGTIFIDEIGELPLKLQPRFLRAVQDRIIVPVGGDEEHPIDVRIIAATNRNLAADVLTGRFREDLLYRLNTFELTMPPLREHPEDIPDILKAHNYDFPADVVAALQKYRWPGNIRDLLRIAERIAADHWEVADVEEALGELNKLPQAQQAPTKPTRDDRWLCAVGLSEIRKDSGGWWSTSDLAAFAKHSLPTVKRDTKAWFAEGRIEKRGVKQTTRYRIVVAH